MATDITIADATGLAAQLSALTTIETNVIDLRNQVTTTAANLSNKGDKYPVRTSFGAPTTYTMDLLQTASDIVSSSASGSAATASWDLAGDGSLDIPIANTSGTAQIIINLDGTTFTGKDGLAIKAECTPQYDDFEMVIVATLTDDVPTNLGPSTTMTVHKVRGMDSAGATTPAYVQVLEEIEAEFWGATRLKLDFTWQLQGATGGEVEIIIADLPYFNDHTATISTQDIMKSGRAGSTAYDKRTSSFSPAAGVSEGLGYHLEAQAATTLTVTLNDTGWTAGARLRFWIDTPGAAGVVSFVAGGGASLISFGTITSIGAASDGALIEAEFNGTDWMVSSPI